MRRVTILLAAGLAFLAALRRVPRSPTRIGTSRSMFNYRPSFVCASQSR